MWCWHVAAATVERRTLAEQTAAAFMVAGAITVEVISSGVVVLSPVCLADVLLRQTVTQKHAHTQHLATQSEVNDVECDGWGAQPYLACTQVKEANDEREYKYKYRLPSVRANTQRP